ncbi:hypothetical protein C5Y96_10850 [Blastopirellula marina]|uniref:DUF4304 domain-containing protein n=1 Tax=Blastopirellula marina TaxID=124 RepID=A0A2S8FMC4_9BACT|nr:MULTISPECIES: hypothetical protein [Pirellulaceae]PQO33342.1 hypothetical protein C5Y96_10850 [Blastopirellula marina]RCS52431.1 hypothetical protein DTL36_10860 [Bremerella cremea]
MKAKQFDKLAKEAFGSMLQDFGFTSDQSRGCTFYRRVNDDLYHLIIPDLLRSGERYDVMVFPFCPRLDPLFSEKFPDSLGIPTGSFCYLAPSGVGPDQTLFEASSEERFFSVFNSQVAPLLKTMAVGYLDQVQSLENMLPLIRSPHQKALASFYVHGDAASRVQLEQQRDRLAALDTDDKTVSAILGLIESLLSTPA